MQLLTPVPGNLPSPLVLSYGEASSNTDESQSQRGGVNVSPSTNANANEEIDLELRQWESIICTMHVILVEKGRCQTKN